MAGKYKCVGKNRLGSVSNEFQLLIQGQRSCTRMQTFHSTNCAGSIYWRRFPESRAVKINHTITLKCEGESSEPLQYQWYERASRETDTGRFSSTQAQR